MRRLALELALHVLQFRLQLEHLGLLGQDGALLLAFEVLFLPLQAIAHFGHPAVDHGLLLGLERQHLLLDRATHLLFLGQLRLELGSPRPQHERCLPCLLARYRQVLLCRGGGLGARVPQQGLLLLAVSRLDPAQDLLADRLLTQGAALATRMSVRFNRLLAGRLTKAHDYPFRGKAA
jgi:hypothetical protein